MEKTADASGRRKRQYELWLQSPEGKRSAARRFLHHKSMTKNAETICDYELYSGSSPTGVHMTAMGRTAWRANKDLRAAFMKVASDPRRHLMQWRPVTPMYTAVQIRHHDKALVKKAEDAWHSPVGSNGTFGVRQPAFRK